MNDGFLSQEEIDSLLKGETSSSSNDDNKKDIDESKDLSEDAKDLLGEIGNISMGSASTALSSILNQQVNITTPVVNVSTLKELKDKFEVPNISLEVKYTSGIDGGNLLVMKLHDAGIIANLMMGGEGVFSSEELSEIEISAVSEAMNQMIGSAATSMATMFSKEINIDPPNSSIWEDETDNLSENISDEEQIVCVSFKLTVGELIDSTIMQIFPMKTANEIVSVMMGEDKKEEKIEPSEAESKVAAELEIEENIDERNINQEIDFEEPQPERESFEKPKVEVQQAEFKPLNETKVKSVPRNIDLILDVPLEISVVLGRTKKSIKDILNFGTGSLIELDKLAEEPVEILVNGKKVAYGEVVVVDENFGVRITSIVSNTERVKSLGR